MAIPDRVKTARRLEDLKDAADHLHNVNSLDAAQPLARLSRVAPGWVFIEVAAILLVLVCLAVLFLANVLLAGGVWSLALVYRAGMALPDVRLKGAWFGAAALVMLVTIARDERLRELLEDSRFTIVPKEVNWLWAGVLWPLSVSAQAMRLLGALLFLALALLPVMLGAVIVAGMWVTALEQGRETAPLLFSGVASSLLYVLFGLFVFSDWPRKRRTSYHPDEKSLPMWAKLFRVAVAGVIASGLGFAIARISLVFGVWAGGLAGTFYFLLWLRWLRAWQVKGIKDILRLKELRIRLAPGQIRFYNFTVILLALLGLTVTGIQQGIDFAVVIGIAACIYPIGLGPALAKMPAWPFFWIRQTAIRMVTRIRARIAIARAVRTHRARNRALVGKRGARAICREHLARFSRKTVRLAYGRKWRYWSCRVCGNDAHAIAGAKTFRGVFDDQPIDGILRQEETVLWVDLLRVSGIPLDLDEVHVKAVQDPHSIEQFIVAYENHSFPVEAPALSDIRLTIAPDADLELNIQNMLRSRFRS